MPRRGRWQTTPPGDAGEQARVNAPVRHQLLVLLLTAVSVAWIVAATVSFLDARHEVAEVLDAHLAQTASLISVQRDGDFCRSPGTQAPGSGLGLSIVHRILDLHRGTIQLDAPKTGTGLQVTVALPRLRDERV